MADIKGSKIGSKVIEYETIGSTNDELKELIKKNEVCEGTVVVANEQTKGRGRINNRKWTSTTNDGVYMSIYLKPTVKSEDISSLTLVTAVAVQRAIFDIAKVETSIKWPNDIVYNNKKLGGILLESSFSLYDCNYVIIGIGINVLHTEFNEELRKIATSLFIETRRQFSIQLLIQKVIEYMNIYYNIFINKGFNAIKSDYVGHCINIGKKNIVLETHLNGHNTDKALEVKAIDISDKGLLVVEDLNGNIYSLNSGEVSVRI